MPPNYANGKIYTIRSRSRPDLVYVGSTTQTLAVRLGGHKVPSNHCRSKQIIELGDSYIELYENYACTGKDELNRREGEVMRSMDCVNLNIPGRTLQEYYQDNTVAIAAKVKQYYQDNTVAIAAKSKQYNQDNAVAIAAKSKQYYQDNRVAIAVQHKQYNQDNAVAIAAKSKQYNQDNAVAIAAKSKQYYQDNRVEIAVQHKQYRLDNTVAIAAKGKQYYQDNTVAIAAQQKQYRLDNTVAIAAQQKQYLQSKKNIQTCVCGAKYNYGKKSTRDTHYRSNQHQNHIQLIHAKLLGE
jgi:tRNA A37 threonylcarbamoyltransferase TsaD